jgi:hypothetical protein
MATKKITKEEANKAASVVTAYAKQEAKAHVKKGAQVTAKATKKYASAGFKKLKGLFK